ncbi:MAG: tyrosine-type recombinase/integrase [bacterium]|nr:tyrosine-type recombinase/integrase [bacterium]
MGEVIRLPDRTPSLGGAIEAFFADKDLSANSRRSYRQTLDALVADLGEDLPVDKLTGAKVKRVLGWRWGEASPATWNARITALQSFIRYCRRNQWLRKDPMAAIDRKRVPRDQTKAIAYDDLDKLWSRPDIGLREKTLWKMLYETAARANEILALNIEDLDQARKRAVVIGKGGHREIVIWASGTARLLPRYLAGRKRGPVFVTNRRPNVVPADPDVCPDTGHGRLSYTRAWSAFKDASGGWTLHQLRHSSLTHLGEEGVSAILLQAKSRHQDPRTLARYAKPGIEAVAALTAEFDRGRRHRQ